MHPIHVMPDESYSILSLLPYSEETKLVCKYQKIQDLYLIQSLTDIAITALETFLNGQLSSFDAQVGENLCQIRAYKVLQLAKKWLNGSQFHRLQFEKKIKIFKAYNQRLAQIILDWETAIVQAKEYNKNLDASEKAKDFLERHQLLLWFGEDIFFLIACYFLSHFACRCDDIPIAIDYNTIINKLNISKHRAKRITHKFQLSVCKIGCDFIKNILRDIPQKLEYMELMDSICKISDEDRMVLPCMIVTDIILTHCLQEKTPILIIHRKKTLSRSHEVIYFLLSAGDGYLSYYLTPLKEQYKANCLIISGDAFIDNINETIEIDIYRILKLNILRLILANTASHPQYSGKRLAIYKDNPFLDLSNGANCSLMDHMNQLVQLRQFAVEKGCSQQNQTIFFLKHIYASTALNEISKLHANQDLKIYEASEIIRPQEDLKEIA